jgi:homoserine kinase
MKVRVSVPASVAPFEGLGLALALTNEVIVDPSTPGEFLATGDGTDAPHLVRDAFDRFARATSRTVPPQGLTLVNRIPPAGGLGSSAAAIVGGLLAADALCDTGLSRMRLLEMAGDPDHAAPAIYGGAVLTVPENGRLTVRPLRVPAGWTAALFLADLAPLPRASRAALLVAAIAEDRPDLLRAAMGAALPAPIGSLIQAALEGGAWGAWDSGSTILALAPTAKAEDVAAAMRDQARSLTLAGRALVLGISPRGATVEPLT